MRYLILLLLISTGVSAQFTPVPGTGTNFTVGGRVYWAYTPAGYDTANTNNLHLMLAFVDTSSGNGDKVALAKRIIAGDWNSTAVMGSAITKQVCYLAIFNSGGYQPDYVDAINAGFASFSRIDTSKHNFSMLAYGAAVQRAFDYRNGGSTFAYLFNRGVFIQTSQTFPSTGWTANANSWFWYAAGQSTGDYQASYTTYVYGTFSGTKKITDIVGNYNTQTVDSALTVYGLNTSTGGAATTNRIRYMIDPTDNVVFANKVTGIKGTDLIDLGGMGGDPRLYFDEQSADPERGINTACTTSGIPDGNKLIYFPQMNGRQWQVGINLRAKYKLQAVYLNLKDNNPLIDDSVFVYKTSDFKTLTEMGNRRFQKGSNGWYKIPLADTTQWVVVGVKRGFGDFSSVGAVSLAEVMLYGDPITTREAAIPDEAPAYDKKNLPTVENLMGINLIAGYVKNDLLKPYKNIRIMADIGNPGNLDSLWYTTWLSGGEAGMLFNLDHGDEYKNGSYWRVQRGIIDSLNMNGHYVTLNQNDASYKIRQIYGFNGPRINLPSDNPYDPASYSESGAWFKAQSAMLGSVGTDTNTINTRGVPKYSGTRMNYNIADRKNNVNISDGNELSGTWKDNDTVTQGKLRYVNNRQYMTMAVADWRGMRSSDPTIRFTTSTLHQPDILSVQSFYHLSKAMTGEMFIRRIQTNEYPAEDGHGAHPVKVGYTAHWKNYVNAIRAIDPTFEIENTETGYDANPASSQSTPIRTGSTWTNREWQAICNSYLFHTIAGTGLTRFYYYCAVTNADEANGGAFQTSDHIVTYRNGNVEIKHPTWYYTANTVRLLTGYYQDTIIESTWNGKFLARYRNRLHPDSVAYVIGKASQDGTALTNATINTGALIGTATVHDLSFTAETTSTQTLSATAGTITIPTVTEKLLIVLLREYIPPYGMQIVPGTQARFVAP